MAIYNPDPFLAPTDRELLRLLSELILAQETGWSDNRNRDCVDLTDDEAHLLLELLEKFISTKRFQEASYLIESLFSGGGYNDRNLRNIFLSGRTFHGKARAVATVQWQNFLMRAGVMTSRGDTPYWYRAEARPMDLEYFYRMEARLVDAAGIHPRVKSLILAYVRLNLEYVGRVRAGQVFLRQGQIEEKPKELVKGLKDERGRSIGQKPIPTIKIAAVMTIVMDVSTLYTTRDWSVASVLSTIAGSAPPVFLD